MRPYHAQAPPWDEINRADVSIYHIGNHALFHGGIWDLCRRQPGVVVLHDARLQELAAAWAELRGNREDYVATMKRYHGARGAAAAEDVCSGVVSPGDLVEASSLPRSLIGSSASWCTARTHGNSSPSPPGRSCAPRCPTERPARPLPRASGARRFDS
jgi:hypothetical protein